MRQSLALLWMAALCSPATWRARVEEAAAAANGRVGAAVVVVETGESASVRGAEHFPMQSVYKVPIAMAVLRRVDEGALELDQKIPIAAGDVAPPDVYSPIRDKYPKGGIEMTLRGLARAAVVESDGTASDLLLRLVPPEDVTRFLRGVGLSAIEVATSEADMARDHPLQHRNWATPDATAKLFALLQRGRGLSESSRELLLEWLRDSKPGPGRIKGLLPAGTRVAHKTGTSLTENGSTAATNDAALITLPDGRHLALAVYVADSPADERTREQVIAKISRATYDCWISRNGSRR